MNDLKNKFVLGLTGPTGAGKSTVASMLIEQGFSVVDADKAARRVTEKGSDVLNEIAAVFGKDILKDGELDRPLLASRAFRDKESTEKLNAITHPAILGAVKKAIEDLANEGKTKIILDAPQLFEAGAQGLCDFILSVLATRETRIYRIMARDGITREQTLRRMSAQLSDDFFIENSDFVIYNDSDACAVNTQINTLTEKISERLDLE